MRNTDGGASRLDILFIFIVRFLGLVGLMNHRIIFNH